MKRSIRFLGMAALTAAMTVASAATSPPVTVPAPANDIQNLAHRVQLYAGEVKVIPIRQVKRVALGNGKLVSIQQAGDQLIMIGQAMGTTNMLVWLRDGTVEAYNIMIAAQDAGGISASLSSALGDITGLHVDSRGGRVVLSGDVTADDYKRVQTATQNVPGVINLAHPLSVDMQRMVYLDVQVVDFKKSALRNIGIDWQKMLAGPVLGVVKDVTTNPYYRIGDVKQGSQLSNQFNNAGGAIQGLPTSVPYSEYFGITTSLSSVINIAAQNGDAYILANPQLSTRSGGEASFLAGGQIPIPISSVLGQSSVQYKDYGVHLDIKPHADAAGNILADIDTEVSQIDPSVTINSYPGFLTRKTSSVVNVKSGQTIVLSGLVQASGSDAMNKFPWLGDVPILGALFRNKDFQASKSELVIFVTPVIIDPESRINHEVIGRGSELIHNFNTRYGDDVDMPGFGVGPTAQHEKGMSGAPIEGQAAPPTTGQVPVAAPVQKADTTSGTVQPADDGSRPTETFPVPDAASIKPVDAGHEAASPAVGRRSSAAGGEVTNVTTN